MGALLLYNPWVQLYVLYAAALGVVFICAYWRNPPVIRNGAKAVRNEVAQGRASLPSRPRSPESCRPSRQGRRQGKEVLHKAHQG
jgi:hypothetical protein